MIKRIAVNIVVGIVFICSVSYQAFALETHKMILDKSVTDNQIQAALASDADAAYEIALYRQTRGLVWDQLLNLFESDCYEANIVEVAAREGRWELVRWLLLTYPQLKIDRPSPMFGGRTLFDYAIAQRPTQLEEILRQRPKREEALEVVDDDSFIIALTLVVLGTTVGANCLAPL